MFGAWQATAKKKREAVKKRRGNDDPEGERELTATMSTRSLVNLTLLLAAAVLVLGTTSFLRWSISGMETTLFTAAVTAALAAQSRARLGWTTFFLCVATLTRPDGALFAGIIYLFSLGRILQRGPRGWWTPSIYAGVMLLLTGFRLVYYGSAVPNTFHAKVGGIPIEVGVYYFVSFLRDGMGLLLVRKLDGMDGLLELWTPRGVAA